MTIQQAKELALTCRFLKDDLPDGMWEEVKEALDYYRETKDGETLAEDMESICQDWGFSI